MLKRKKLIVLSMAIILTIIVATALLSACVNEREITGSTDSYSFSAKGQDATLSEYLLTSADSAVIPETIEYTFQGATYKFNVTAIDANCFKGMTNLVRVTIPGAITQIGDSAFEGCTNLATVTFLNPKQHETFKLGAAAFKDCTKLKSITLPSGITTMPRDCFKNSFATGTDNLTTVIIPESVVKIDESAFENSKVQRVNLPQTLNEIGIRAFAKCKSLTLQMVLNENNEYVEVSGVSDSIEKRTFTFPSSLTTIRRQAFYHCEAVRRFKIPTSVTLMEGGCFAGGYYTNTLLDIAPENEHYYFAGNQYCLLSKDKTVLVSHTCYSVNLVNYTGDLAEIKEIAPYAFGSDTSNASAYNLPASLEKIGEYAFFELTDSSYNADTDPPRPRFNFAGKDCEFYASSFSQNALLCTKRGENGTVEANFTKYKNAEVGDYFNNWTIENLTSLA